MAGLNKKKEFCVWAHFDEESSLALNHIKERANANLSGPKFEAHLTLVGSLESVDSSTSDALSLISNKYEPFVVKTNGIQMKDKFFQALFIKIKEEKHLIKFRNEIGKSLNVNLKEFFPHVSLYYGREPAKKKDQVKKGLLFIPDELKVDRITLVDTTKDIKLWNVIKTFPLK